jgi:Ca2+-binding RTX toxin-like protein
MYDSLAQAQSALETLTSSGDALKTDLLNLIRNCSVHAEGAVTMLYSAGVAGGPSSSEIVDSMIDEGLDIRVVDKSVAAKLIQSDDFGRKVAEAFDISFTEYSRPGYRGPATDWLGHATDGPWADVSRRFARESVGDVRIIAPEGQLDRIFSQTELPELLAEGSGVTAIDGIPKSQLIEYERQHGPAALRLLVFDHSHIKVYLSGLVSGDTSRYLDFPPPDRLSEVLSDPVRFGISRDMVDALNIDGRLDEFTITMKQADEVGGDMVRRGLLPHHLNKLGRLGAVAGFMIVSSAAAAAAERGDDAEAEAIMRDWAVDAAGSTVGEAVGASIGGIAVGLMAAAGVVVAAPVAAVVVFGAAIAGGFLGAEVAADFSEWLGDQDDAQRRDALERLQRLYFGDEAVTTIESIPDREAGFIWIEEILQIGRPVETSPDALAAAARVNLAFRYALTELNPFVVMQSNAFYEEKHNTSGQLDLYDAATGQGLTEEYLLARAKALFTKAKLLHAGETITAGHVYPGGHDFHYLDADEVVGEQDAGVHLDLHYLSDSFEQIMFGGDGDDTLQASTGRDMLFGGDGADRLIGAADSDYLEGGRGDDILDGGSGADLLRGGDGYDTYVASAGDIVDDHDGAGRVLLDGDALSGGTLDESGGRYLSDGGHYQYWMQGDDLKVRRLRDDASLVIKSFASGDLDIRLTDAPESPGASSLIVGGDDHQVLHGTTNASSLSDCELTNHYNLPDHIQGHGGRDWIYASEPMAYLDSDGNLVCPAPDTDLVEGGADRDYIHGGAGDDALYATELVDAAAVMAGSGALDYGEAGDYVSGQSGNDLLVGSGQLDGLFGGGGDDLIYGGGGDDQIYADWNTQLSYGLLTPTDFDYPWYTIVDGRIATNLGSYVGGIGNDRVYAGEGHDDVTGGAGDDHLHGEAGDDRISGDLAGTRDGLAILPGEFHGDDYLSGGAGDDVLNGNGGDDVLIGGIGDDWLEGDVRLIIGDDAVYHGDDYLDGGDGIDHLSGQGGSDVLLGGDGDDLLFGDLDGLDALFHGADRLYGGAGVDQMIGHGGDDMLFGGSGNDIIYGDDVDAFVVAGNDLVDGGDGDDQLSGGLGDDRLRGGQGVDSLWGDAGDDILMGGTGLDMLDGGSGADTYVFSAGDGFTADTPGAEWVFDRSGEGNVLAFDASVDPQSLSFALNGTAGDVIISYAESDKVILQGGLTADFVSFADGSLRSLPVFIAETQANMRFLTGSDINDQLLGSDAADELLAGAGDDHLYGGAGDDRLDGGTGANTLIGGPGVDTYLISAGTGAGVASITANIIKDNEGEDSVIEFSAGIHASDFKRFNDFSAYDSNVQFVASGVSVLIENGDYGQVVDSFRFANGDEYSFYEFKDLIEQAATAREGTAIGETVVGDDTNEVISAYAGNDVLHGNGGRDLIDGGSGADTMIGGQGFDEYIVDDINDIVVENPGEGWDIVRSSVTYTLPEHVEYLYLTGDAPIDATGNATDNTLGGNSAANTIYGGAGEDSIRGNGGGDRLFGGDGDDTIYGVTGDYLDGGPGDDTLKGDYRSPVSMNGGDGDDFLEAWVPTPSPDSPQTFLQGGGGNDTYRLIDGYYIDSEAVITESFDAGMDTLKLSSQNIVLARLPENIENIEYHYRTGPWYSDRVALAGNDLDNEMRVAEGNPNAVHELRGHEGNDTLIGSGFDDPGAPGRDKLFGGEGNDRLLGLANDDQLFGNDGDDQLEAGAGNDSLIGGAGIDWLSGGSGDDSYSFIPGDGADILIDSDGNDEVRFDSHAVHQDDLIVDRIRNDLRLQYSTDDSITIRNWFSGEQHRVESVRFSNGEMLTALDLETRIAVPVHRVGGTNGKDILHGSENHDLIDGSPGNDIVFGYGGNDSFRIVAGDGFDIFYGGDGVDRVYGEFADDVIGLYADFDANNSIEEIDGGAGVNRILGSWHSSTLDFRGTSLINIDSIDGGAGNDTIIGTENGDVIIGGRGNDHLHGGNGDDEFRVVAGDGADVFHGGEGTDRLVASLADDEIRLFGDFGAANSIEVIDGGGGVDRIRGTWHSSILDFSHTTLTGIASIDGGPGNDTIIATAGDDVLVSSLGNNTYFGGDGYDRVVAGSEDGAIGLLADFGAANSIEEIDGGTTGGWIRGSSRSSTLDFSSTALLNLSLIHAGAGRDTVVGTVGDDVIAGGRGNDTLHGGDGDDEFRVSVDDGADVFFGGDGIDRVITDAVDNRIRLFGDFGVANSIERIDGGDGTNWVEGTWHSNTLDFSATSLVNVAGIDGGSGNDTIIGTDSSDLIVGGRGNDVLHGGPGDDEFHVADGDGADVFHGGDGVDRLIGSLGDDEIRLYGDFGIGNSIEEIDGGGGINRILGTWHGSTLDFSHTRLVGIAAIDGGHGHDTIIGTGGDDVIIGSEGSDTLHGGAGNDVFEVATGDGADTFFGGEGHDRIIGESAASEIRLFGDFGPTNSIEEIDGGSAGARILGTWHASTLDFSAVALRNIVAIDGGSGVDTIIGTVGDDVILGGRGNDTLRGGDGDDRYQVSAGDGQDLIADASGNDTLAFASANHDQLWFERSGDDLLVSTIGTSDRVRIDAWYRSVADQVESFESLDGQALANSSVEQLVAAMAAFSRPAIGEMELGHERQEALAPVLAASWQAT